MPELPEVETVRLGLERSVTGKVVTGVRILDPRAVRRHDGGPQDFTGAVTGRLLGNPRRRGKYLWVPLGGVDPMSSAGDALLCHLGMSGQFRIDDAGTPLLRHTRVVLDLDDGRELRFLDQRLFGGMQVSRGGALLPAEISHIGPDPFDAGFDAVVASRRLRARRSTLKRALLDQSLVSGIGNIYADETLWRARRHPETPTSRLRAVEAAGIYETAREVMAEAIDQGGTSFDRLYVRVNGETGYFGRSLDVYGREGAACRRCGAGIVRMAFMNRSSYLCPRCQRWPRGVPRL
ncbi:bifunctional DNA-formamidopyrimidine glycosylase/DNA-(apurinic or apyrimidinic site) lyase [Acidipropionibacterium virtanenii]|uniref:Formamidopyrimidine-DNA glycosylase n=1 Tax=Acidipropionibacterium virtanenii TaxID=2057246 RepID=A0A344UTB4_9ACTN|nr:bifunctional DNA-formamidopyrimidine glycosylase/DNA-(apurinic or apyrimidinic site) lyase [Acidipropionibacterium virtanenii]AXE38512.1 Formamidopyrimidine-DNA glycosylase 1 [Acidipropionibacterium virtanenii]